VVFIVHVGRTVKFPEGLINTLNNTPGVNTLSALKHTSLHFMKTVELYMILLNVRVKPPDAWDERIRTQRTVNLGGHLTFFRLPWKNVLDIVQNYWAELKKFGPLSEKSSPHLMSQAGYGPADTQNIVATFSYQRGSFLTHRLYTQILGCSRTRNIKSHKFRNKVV